MRPGKSGDLLNQGPVNRGMTVYLNAVVLIMAVIMFINL